MMADIITIQNEFSCLEYQHRTDQMRTLIRINVKFYIQVQKPSQYRSVGSSWDSWLNCILSRKLCYHFVSVMAVVL